MDKKAIKTFAIQARRDLIKSIRLKMENLGITETGVEEKSAASTNEIEYYGDKGLFISGQDIKRRRDLVSRLKTMAKQEEWRDAFSDLIEEVAYTWFNRIIAIRFMEVNDYLPSDVRVLSSETKLKVPDILREAFNIEDELGGYSSDERAIIQKALDTEEPSDMDAAYVILFTKQANALNQYLPELFEKTDDFMQLLFTPSYSVGVIRDLVDDIREDDFDVDKGGQVEIIGWLYQYYNTDPKDNAFKKKKYLTSDIPPVTQLFTPDWIVKYLVENSLGRYWIRVLLDRGDKRTSAEIAESFGWHYFMPDAKQNDSTSHPNMAEKRIEDITFVDPAMGSGHILIYAFDVFLQIYQAEGYSRREAAQKIVKDNLFGFDIDRRAFQLAYFAMMMKLRCENRRTFDLHLKPNIFEVPTTTLTPDDFSETINANKTDNEKLKEFLTKFNKGKELGSLIDFSADIFKNALINEIIHKQFTGQLTFDTSNQLTHRHELKSLVRVGMGLSNKYTISVTNPPYMGSGKMPKPLSDFVGKNYPASKSDLFAVFIERLQHMTKQDGFFAMITQHQWMFLSSFKSLRERMINWPIINMAHLGTRAFEEIGGEVVQTTAFIIQKQASSNFIGTYERLVDFDSQTRKEKAYLAAVKDPKIKYVYRTKQTNFEKIPGTPLAYWVPGSLLNVFSKEKISDFAFAGIGMRTGDNKRFLRRWSEVCITNSKLNEASVESTFSGIRWIPYNKGGNYRKWYGNNEYVVNWLNDGQEIKDNTKKTYPELGDDLGWKISNEKYYFRPGITWTGVTSGTFNARFYPDGFIFDSGANGLFPFDANNTWSILAFLNSSVGNYLLKLLNPTINTGSGNIRSLPFLASSFSSNIDDIVQNSVSLSQEDWDSCETSWNFCKVVLTNHIAEHHRNWTVEAAFNQWKEEADKRFKQLKANEEELNRIFIDLYGLQDELAPEEEDKDVSVRRADLSRDIKAFMSYFVGCVFGRYSIDTPGLAYAGGDWDDSKYKTFLPNEDDVIVLTDDDYFGDNRDVVNRFKEFLSATFGAEHLDENMQFIAVALGKRGSSSEEIIRAYLRDNFFKKDHLSTYQKRPIYWELNSGRNGGFKALMYLHRYDKNTMAMIRTKYLHPLQEAYERRLDQLKSFEANEQQTRQRNAIKKQITTITKQLDELVKYDEKLQHVANLHIDLDLDDGVLVNHAKAQADTKIFTPLK
ncbi:BREX-1 system adenine-specific DNA-methyltransferase PglX [Lacticaseibacillus rhamnosus]|uniref:BREX-1 system adenine-specific DNA-methyltransferase PglX n=2 Tax=Lacticaseibacillus rhamnosus TaxID=47715 RepID=UPI00057E8D21|nr:BREX-1 system adenine-specific DNA-methyltransferase PglX [Lacticaseibacillus rhamnosus]KIC97983.1 restriction endonuclease subunit M [Lacticaseibacillus rhamnosus]OAU38274.1 restriction endonuclease subunit M [Lacticaseibacillus rhamnosus]QPB48266.1 BREX-1 system adenine-specific DNA-methyltransferase PglX [Lacticaseibacillus rhamnosus]UTX33506.1 BREX-1 system adenine-specific DNA-methyltransferase PglX [Lacticaseibacillus rhamnosus]WPG26089.1 BREX-1 system adenine-specific DNA-methyltrans